MVPCNPRDREAAHRAQFEGIATEIPTLTKNIWIISNLVETKMDFFLKNFYYQGVMRMEKTRYCPVVPCPGKKAFASPKKAVVPLFLMRASAVSARRSLCRRVSLRKRRRGN
jgi:hypothetical protein